MLAIISGKKLIHLYTREPYDDDGQHVGRNAYGL
jgi:hypothetical protein